MSITMRQRLDLLRAAMETERSSFTTHWRELADHISPRRARFYSFDVDRGDRRNARIIDSTATISSRILAAGMHSGLTSPSSPWFRITTPDPSLAKFGRVKDWLAAVTNTMSSVFLQSNLYTSLPTVYNDMGIFGTGCTFLEEDQEDGIRCTPYPIGNYAIALDAKLRVRTFLRPFRMTVRQVVERFGGPDPKNLDWKNISASTKSAYQTGKTEEWRSVVHVIFPNPEWDPTRLESKYRQFRSIYYEKSAQGEQFLEDKGFEEFPVFAPRWSVAGEDIYGTDCPGMIALGDIKALQVMRKRGAQALEKQLNPPMMGPTALRGNRASLLPGDITYVDSRDGQQAFRPVHETRVALGDLRVEAQDVRQLIQRAFFEDLFLMMLAQEGRMTATEVIERKGEKVLMLGPTIEQTEQDLLDPLVNRTFMILNRAGRIPPAPKELVGTKLKVEYVSIMARAQKEIATAGVERFTSYVTNLAQTDPAVMDTVNKDEMVSEMAEITGVPSKFIRPPEEVQQLRETRQKQMAAQQQAKTLKDVGAGAKSLSQADTSGDNALTDILAGGKAA